MKQRTLSVLVLVGLSLWLSVVPAVWGQADSAATVLGTASEALTAYAGKSAQAPCEIAAGETVLAVGRTASGNDLLLYASGKGCEGPAWIASVKAANIAWDDEAALENLPTAVRPTQPTRRTPLNRLDRYDEICEGATWASFWPGTRPLLMFAGSYGSSFSRDQLATSVDEVDILVCVSREDVVINSCPYTGGYTLQQVRQDVDVKIVNFETGGYAAWRTFYGSAPPGCPWQRSFYSRTESVWGNEVADSEWIAWVNERLNSLGAGTAALRTTVNASPINVRNESSTSSDILGQLDWGTPVNLIARNEGSDWVVALLPDMSKGWLFVSLLTLATDTNVAALPVFDGPAADAPITLPE